MNMLESVKLFKYRYPVAFEAIISQMREPAYVWEGGDCPYSSTYDDWDNLSYQINAHRFSEDMEGADFDWGCGATKIVACLNDVVFKTAYTGVAICEGSKSNTNFYSFNRRDMGNYNYSPDYCDVEARVYQRAKEWGVEEFFAETVELFDGIYVQERYKSSVGHDGLSEYGLTEDDVREIREAYGLSSRLSYRAIAHWFSTCSSQKLERFSEFLEYYDINDLHSGNVAWMRDGSLRLIDYSGFNSSTNDLV